SALNNALSRPVMVTVLQLAGLAIKFPLNALFLYGGMGVPAMGGPGCALASMIISWLWFVAAAAILMRNPAYKPLAIFTQYSPPNRARLWALVRLGVPMGFTYLIEITSFTLMAIFIARLGTVVLAGHQIAANLGAVAY
ncbi:MATE family efflux transporter, partial [Micromonospora craterilacus]